LNSSLLKKKKMTPDQLNTYNDNGIPDPNGVQQPLDLNLQPGQHKIEFAAANRRRKRSSGYSVSQEVEHQMLKISNSQGDDGITEGYMPSFATSNETKRHQSLDVGTGINLRNINNLGGHGLLHRTPNTEPPKNSLDEIGKVPKSNPANAKSLTTLSDEGGGGGGRRGFPHRHLSLDLSHGPIRSSLDNEEYNQFYHFCTYLFNLKSTL
jgi:hypothetical protein